MMKRRLIPFHRPQRHMRCECGRQANRRLWFRQLNSFDVWIVQSLDLCGECFAEMLASDPTASKTPLAAPMRDERIGATR